MLKSLLGRLLGKKPRPLYSMILLARTPYAPTEELFAAAGERAFKTPFDGSEERHAVAVSPAMILIKAGDYLFSVLPKWGAYLAKSAEDDVETGAALLPEYERPYWREQRAWYAYDILNNTIGETEASQALASLLFELLDDRCCGIWIPHQGRFLPNDGTAHSVLARWSLGEGIPSTAS